MLGIHDFYGKWNKQTSKVYNLASEANESIRRLRTPFVGDDEMAAWSKALQFLQSDKYCPRFEPTKFRLIAKVLK